MNRHKYMAYPVIDGKIIDGQPMQHKIGGEKSGWFFSDTVSHVSCPRCKSDPGYECESPKGRAVWPPHTERMKAASAVLDDNDYRVKTISPTQLKELFK